jgi:hypothetical protein
MGIGTAVQKDSEKKSLKYKEEEANQNAALQKIAANDAIAEGEQAAQDQMRQVSQVKADQTAVAAANGLDISQGTPASLLADTQYMGDIDTARIKRNAKRQAWGHGVEATNMTNTANMFGATADGINPAASGLLAAAGSVASNWGGISKSYNAKYGSGGP